MVRPFAMKHIKDPKILEEFQRESMWSLLPNEVLWRDRYDILYRNGYQLRSRFRPDWVPSWKNTDLNPFLCEDAFGFARSMCIDAIRMKDKTAVFIKRVVKDAAETEIQLYLSDGERREDPKNHCCPVLDVFCDREDEGHEYLVLPVLRNFDNPPFYAVTEVFDFVQQTLEGLKFMHDNKIAHCDCASPNIMMDGTSLYPEGFHPAQQSSHPTIQRFAKKKRRLYASPVKYYFIDFGLSVMQNEEWETDPREWRNCNGREQDAPEIRNYSGGTPYNAYLLDRFILGKVYQRSLLERYSNIDVLKPIVDGMTRERPEERLSPGDAIVLLSKIRQSLSTFRLRGKLHRKCESMRDILVDDFRARIIDVPFMMKEYI